MDVYLVWEGSPDAADLLAFFLSQENARRYLAEEAVHWVAPRDQFVRVDPDRLEYDTLYSLYIEQVHVKDTEVRDATDQTEVPE